MTGMTVTVPSQIFADAKRTNAVAERYVTDISSCARSFRGAVIASSSRAIFQAENVGDKIAYITTLDDDVWHRAVRSP